MGGRVEGFTRLESDPKQLQIGDCVNGLFGVVIEACCDENDVASARRAGKIP